MREEKFHIYLNDDEYSRLIQSLIRLKNSLTAQGRCTDAVDDILYASSLDGSDKCVRLEAYMADEHGGKDGWKIEKCYVKDDSNREMLDIIAGKFFIAYAPIESEKFLSMPKELARKYEEKFKYPERFYKSLDGIEAKPYKPVSKEMER